MKQTTTSKFLSPAAGIQTLRFVRSGRLGAHSYMRRYSKSTVIVKHTVRDYAKWKPVFDERAGTRKAAGCQGGKLYLDAQNPNDVTIVFKWTSVKNARSFVESPDY